MEYVLLVYTNVECLVGTKDVSVLSYYRCIPVYYKFETKVNYHLYHLYLICNMHGFCEAALSCFVVYHVGKRVWDNSIPLLVMHPVSGRQESVSVTCKEGLTPRD